MIERISNNKTKFIVGLFVVLYCWGTYSLAHLPLTPYPILQTTSAGHSLAPSLPTQEVESIITAPIEVAVANIPDIIELRSISRWAYRW